MIPPNFNEATTSNAEQLLYYRLLNHLEDDWTVIHSLPWLDDSRPRLREGECDFLLLHPRHGLLVLEAKSGAPQYNGNTRQWHYDDGKNVTDPIHQARSGMHTLVEKLERQAPAWQKSGLPYGYAVAFPDARSIKGGVRPDMNADLIMLEPDLEQVQAKIIRLLGRFGAPASDANEEAIADALAVLQPSFRLVPGLAPTIEAAGRALVRLTADQAEVFDGMSDNPRLLVHGGAGTGKSLLIVAEARQLAAKGKSVLVLCFNRPLGASLHDQLGNAGQQIMARTFHDFCFEVLHQAGAEPPDEDDKGYWDLLFEAAVEAMPKTSMRFDAILVDEAQDFRAEWWLMIEDFLVDPAGSHFHLFIDDHQNLYGRSVQLPFTKPECRLRRNCRNTGPVAKFACGAIGLDLGVDFSKLPDGPEPIVHEVSSAEAEWDAVRRVLHNLVNEQGLSPNNIVILGCHKLEKSSFSLKRKLGNLTVMDLVEPEVPNSVRYSTVHKFKGLEADCVLLTGIGAPSQFYGEEHWRRFTYVGGSRAKVVLHVFKVKE